MKRNRRKSNKMSVMATTTMRFAAIIVFFFVMVILNILADSSCRQLNKQYHEMETELKNLEDARIRATANWERMKSPEKLERALLQHGLEMKLPRPEQVVRMRNDGTPRPGQLALKRLRNAVKDAASAEPTRSSAPYRRTRYRR